MRSRQKNGKLQKHKSFYPCIFLYRWDSDLRGHQTRIFLPPVASSKIDWMSSGIRWKNSWRNRNATTSLLQASSSSYSWQKLKNGKVNYQMWRQKTLLSKSTIKGERKFSFSVKMHRYTNGKPYTSCYLDTAKPSAVSNLYRISVLWGKGILSQAHLMWEMILKVFILTAFYWV